MSNGSLRLFFCAFLAAAGPVAAQPVAAVGDPAAGAEIATKGVGNTVVACNFCHGNQGAGAEINGIPYLAGLGSYYIRKQIDDYVSGSRARHPVMAEVAKELSPQQVSDVVAYFGEIQLSVPPPPDEAEADLIARGERIAEIGDPELRIQACSNCHGARGAGGLPAIPPLAGQSARYIVEQIDAFRQGDRNNDGGSQMRSVASRMDEDVTAAVAAYFAQARPAQ